MNRKTKDNTNQKQSTNKPPRELLAFIHHFLKPYPIATSLYIIIALIAGLWGPINAWLMKSIVDAGAASNSLSNPGDTSILITPAILMVLNFIVFDNFTWRSINWINRTYQPLIKNQILTQGFSYLAHAPINFFHNRLSG